MKTSSDKIKILIVIICCGIAIIGFLIKLPRPFRGMDQELHALFFFSASAFLNVLFFSKKLRTHLLIFGMLFLFSALIEFSQEYSNTFFSKKIHGKFDPEDLKFNLLGLTAFSSIWMVYYLAIKFYERNKKSHSA